MKKFWSLTFALLAFFVPTLLVRMLYLEPGNAIEVSNQSLAPLDPQRTAPVLSATASAPADTPRTPSTFQSFFQPAPTPALKTTAAPQKSSVPVPKITRQTKTS